MKDAIQIIQMLALLPPAPLLSPRQWRGLFCPQRVMSAWPIENSRCVLRDECPGWAQWPQFEYHADICRIGAATKERGATLVPFNHAVISVAVNLQQPFMPFCCFQVFMEFETHRWPFWIFGPDYVLMTGNWGVFVCLCLWPQIYTDWANHYLAKSGHKRIIKDLQTDVTDGVLLAEIIQVVGKLDLTRSQS